MNFTIYTTNEDGFDKLILEDLLSKTTAEIIPSCGAILHAFNVFQNEKKINVIDHYESENDFKEHVTSKGFKSCKLSPFACRLKNASYQFEGKNYAVNKFFLGKNGHHGLLYDCVFTVTDQWCDDSKAFVTMKYEYRVFDKGFPFEYDCIVTYVLETDNKLTISTQVVNRSNHTMPIQDGWHPYFTFGGTVNNLQLQFDSKAMVEFDDELLPTGKLLDYADFHALRKIETQEFDNCFLLNENDVEPACILRDTDKNIQLEIYPEKLYPYLQIYIPPHRSSIAIENLSAAPDALNNGMGLIVLKKNENVIFNTVYKISSLNLE